MAESLLRDGEVGVMGHRVAEVTPAEPPLPTSGGFQAINKLTANLQSTYDSPTPQRSSQGVDSDAEASTPAPADASSYGTRARRGGHQRLNYSEDKEMDFEFTSAATTKPKKVAAQDGTDAKRAKDLPQSTTLNGGASHFNAAQSAKDSPSAGSAAPTTNGKKRKATAAVSAPVPPVSHATATSGVRKALPSTAARPTRETNVMTFSKSKAVLNKAKELVADDGTKLRVNDHVYLISEPPGEPYYLCRVMEFLHTDSENPNSPVDSLRVNWYYRPRDVQRYNSDTRLVYATMHSDMCPLTSLRGNCMIKHRSEIPDLELYRKERDAFYFVQVFDRFIRRCYECIPTFTIINVPEKVKKALDERWKFVAVEIGRVKELTSAVKTCKRCTKFAATTDSVDCAICKNSYHMNCVQPPLPKKPSRGFAWACGPCSRESERQQEAVNTPTMSGDVTEVEAEEVREEQDPPGISEEGTRAPTPDEADMPVDDHPATQAEIALAKMWPMRYLGIHCRVEDALQYDDRAIYPRASSRLGPRHQANVNVWHGRPVELAKPADIKKKYTKGNSKKEGKLSKETLAAMEADRVEKAKRPKWVQDEPVGYVPRGEDFPNDDPRCTASIMFKLPEQGVHSDRGTGNAVARPHDYDKLVDDYLVKARPLARKIGVPPFGTNFLDKAVELFTTSNFNEKVALDRLGKVDRKTDLHEPVLTKDQLTRFEEGVSKHGSEHRLVRLHMKTTLPNSDIVRFYYLWKKTPKGKEIWGNFPGRKGKKRVDNDAAAKLHEEVAHDADDSAFDNDKAVKRKRGFQCKYCNTTHARQWRRAPGVPLGQTVLVEVKGGPKERKERRLLALCLRCAGLWRKYGIQWEDVEEVAKKVAQGGGRALKRRVDEELLRELMIANDAAAQSPSPEPTNAVASIENGEPPKKKSKTGVPQPLVEPPKKVEKPPPPPKLPTPPPPPIIPTQPTWKALPCAVCLSDGNTIECAHCKLTIHRTCFGLTDADGRRPDGQVYWVCEQCKNDYTAQVSTDYSCCLCLTEETPVDLVEPPKVSHKKKTEREKEKERMEKELADGMRNEYRNKQLAHHRPWMPREPLKRTAGNNWVHVYCAMWMPEIRFSNAQALELAEGFQLIPASKLEAVCKLCRNKDAHNVLRTDRGACVPCHQCGANFHVSCALEAGYQLGFDVTPVKNSRKDQVTTATIANENGAVVPAIWCKEHTVKSIVHPMYEIADAGLTALQVYAQKFKQADLTLTGTVRKANLAQLTKDKGQQAAIASHAKDRRESIANSIAGAVRRGARNSSIAETRVSELDAATDGGDDAGSVVLPAECRCAKCDIDVTPKWHVLETGPRIQEATPPKSPEARAPAAVIETVEQHHEPPAPIPGQPPEVAPAPTNQPSVNVDITGAPITTRATEPPRPAQNIRFMAPGMNGRAWEGMPERYSSRSPRPPGDAAPNTVQLAAQAYMAAAAPTTGIVITEFTNAPPQDAAPMPGGLYGTGLPASARPPPAAYDPTFLNSLVPQHNAADTQSAAPMQIESQPQARTSPQMTAHTSPHTNGIQAATEAPRPLANDQVHESTAAAMMRPDTEVQPVQYLCHKCFVKRKLNPTPPPPSPPPRIALSPPRQFPLRLDFNGGPPAMGQRPLQRSPWEEPTRSSQPPPVMHQPPQQNGMGQSSGYGIHQAPAQNPAYPPAYHHQPNGYTPGPPINHDRRNGYGFPPQRSPHPSPWPHNRHPPPPMSNYSPHGPPMQNGMRSPHLSHPQQLQTPSYSHGAPTPPQYGPPPRRTASPFSSQLPPLGGPLYSSGHSAFSRANDGHTQQAPHQQPATSAPSGTPGSATTEAPPVRLSAFAPTSETMPWEQPGFTQGAGSQATSAPAAQMSPPAPNPNIDPALTAAPEAAEGQPPGTAEQHVSGTVEQQRSNTPLDTQATTTGGLGASGSPNLRHLLL
ncbi:hypothetical protein B0A48_16087 [Cryoendolithus antarcticus]|uniref:Uncharacterized protein n=1 Tax=Cryoendolithus antarcticus TaxID=1507870 RepID=A0A1V8SF49_9PEZI|nr:hypothetical protein B0A48_16087 [Cryoendolithus antarcticus]